MQKHILSIDDEPRLNDLIRKILWMDGYRVSGATSSDAARCIIASDQPQLIISDLAREDDCLSFLEEIRRILPNVPVLLLTGALQTEEVGAMVGKQVDGVLYKNSIGATHKLRQEVRRLLGDPAL